MQAPAPHPAESQRLEDLYDYGILDTAAERVFDEIAELAAAICGTRYAAITLIDRDRQWFKARYGLSRKFAIPLLEFLDRERVTRRVGDVRIVL